MKTNYERSSALVRTVQAAAIAAALAFAAPAGAQALFPTPEAAADALVDGIARSDEDAVKRVIGSDFRRYIPPRDASDKYAFLGAWARSHGIEADGPDRAWLRAGAYGWTLPIPIVKTAGGWRFDTRAAPEEMRKRRIGRNELAAIQVALAYTDAQEEYFAKDWDGDGAKQFAARAVSAPGKRDGLYWAALPGEPESPLGAEFADAKRGQPYHGYLYRILTAQGPDAPGGARSYVKDGRMTEGYALIAWPERWGETGVMTFIVNRDGVVHEKNLGPGTDSQARRVTAYNPDSTWARSKTKP